MKRWDVFISHASEDNKTVAIPLAQMLEYAGLRVWLDQFELKLGDSLREKIDQGLSECTFGVLILSKAFMAKGWPKREVNGLMALEDDGQKVILPIWHQISKQDLVSFSPILADRLAANTADGLRAVAKQILEVVINSNVDTPSILSPNTTGLLAALLDQMPTTSRIIDFLMLHPKLLSGLGTHDLARRPSVLPAASFAGITIPFAVISLVSTALFYKITLVEFASVDGPLLKSDGTFASDVEEASVRLRSVLQYSRSERGQFWRDMFPGTENNSDKNTDEDSERVHGFSDENTDEDSERRPSFSVEALLYARRRSSLSKAEKAFLGRQREIADEERFSIGSTNIEIISYDRLIDLAQHWRKDREHDVLTHWSHRE